MRRTLIKDGVVVNVIVLVDEQGYTPPADHILGPEGGEIGDTWDGQSYSKPPVPEPPPPTTDDLLAYLANKRWQVETGGCVLNGMVIATDLNSQTKIAGAWTKAKADPAFQIADWKIGPGVFVPLDNATILAVGDAVTAHIQACFSKEKELTAAILSDPPAITTTAEIDAAAWPANS